MNETTDRALQFIKSIQLPENIILHSKAVASKALEIANKIRNKGVQVDLELVSLGGLLHDVGRVRSHGLDHGYVGGLILVENGFDVRVARIAETHVLGGFTPSESEKLGLPKKDFRPKTLEEKICCYADKLILNTKPVSLAERFKFWINKYGKSELLTNALTRVKEIEDILMHIIKDC
ncbi:MAG: HD domain-containing protein [Candidatus Odinarchaeia archaeon]